MDKGLAAAELHRAEVPRSEMKELTNRKDRHDGHHMFPMVPHHALPRPHELIKHDLPVRRLPDTARPHRAELHDAVRT